MRTKRLLAISGAALSLFIGPAVFAQGRTSTSIGVQTSTTATVFVRPFCKFELQFLASSVTKSDTASGGGGVAIVQVFGADGKPMRCAEDVR